MSSIRIFHEPLPGSFAESAVPGFEAVMSGSKPARILNIEKPQVLLSLLRKAGYPIATPCGGRGSCGKCKVGYRERPEDPFEMKKACCTMVRTDCEILIPESVLAAENPAAGSDDIIESAETTSSSEDVSSESPKLRLGDHALAVDLGTTTVALSLIRLNNGNVLGTKSAWNAQIPYGADVISRVQYTMSEENGLNKLSSLIRNQITELAGKLCQIHIVKPESICRIVISGNTIMQHIFAGLDPSAIGRAPYVPEHFFTAGESIDVKMDAFPNAKVVFAPCISGFVGGDITSGLYASGLYEQNQQGDGPVSGTHLFLDIGTNGEMALLHNGKFLTCSVATGPAFEGAEITCGRNSVSGAISHIAIDRKNKKLSLEVIGGRKPEGLCGSGLIDLLAILLETGIVDETGRLLSPSEAKEEVDMSDRLLLRRAIGPDYLESDENGNGIFYLTRDHKVFLTAGDVRKLQLAKASVRAGIEVLFEQENIGEAPDSVIIAGGFGKHLSPDSAVRIGMIPATLQDKIVCIGNSSLTGAQAAAKSPDVSETLEKIRKQCEYLELSGMDAFSKRYMEQMVF